jgi:PadR family transcriptional regulator PadR
MTKRLDLLQGTLDMLILKAVSLDRLHGYGILLRMQQISGERLQIQQGSLYPASTVWTPGLIASEWGESENKRKAKYYRLTAVGRRQLQRRTAKLEADGRHHWGHHEHRAGGIMRPIRGATQSLAFD